jgi:uncharacterized secreted protein with C-terminal beta-propeller domain
MKNLSLSGLSFAVLLLLSACGGSNGGGSGPANSNPLTNAPSLRTAASSAELEAYIKSVMLETYGTPRMIAYPLAVGVPVPSPSAATATATASTTNTQESGVDEADRLKSDGTYLYTASTSKPAVDVFKTAGASAPLVKEQALDTGSSNPLSGLYLYNQQLLALADGQPSVGIWGGWFSPAYWLNQQSQLFKLDVSTPENPLQTAKLTLDGQVISSRRIGSTLYLATRQTPSLKGLIPYPATEADAAANRALINKATLDDFLPNYKLGDVDQGEIFSPRDCLLTRYSSKNNTQASLISLLAIDLDAAAPVPHGKCFVGDAETLYASTDSIYLATTQYNYTTVSSGSGTTTSTGSTASTDTVTYTPQVTTDFHKFALANNTIDYRGSGRVEGHLGWQQDMKPFRMSEYNGVLRVMTYVGDTSSSNATPARLYTLQENAANQSLDILAQLPNSTHPEPLGKVGEQIYATRFLGSRGYLVTFRVTDPLYVLDLSNPADPFVAGELQIKGYSDYLHPVGENLLLGIGKDAMTNKEFCDNLAGYCETHNLIPDFINNTVGDGRGAWYQGVKLSLIDVTDPANPVEKQTMIIGNRGTETAVSQTHHALTTLQQGNTLRVALPVSVHQMPLGALMGTFMRPSDFYNWSMDELYRLEIDTQTGEMKALEPILSERAAPYAGEFSSEWPNDRSAMMGDFIHYLHGDKVISQAW